MRFKRTAGTLDELSYAPCGAGIAEFGGQPVGKKEKHATSNPNDVDCPTCVEWLKKRGKR